MLLCEQVSEVIYGVGDCWVTYGGCCFGPLHAAAMTSGISLCLGLKSCTSWGDIRVFQVVLMFELFDGSIPLFFQLSQSSEFV